MTSPSSSVLEARGIHKRFGPVVALNDVSFQVRAGEVHAIIGENGSGKSTLIKIISGVYKPDAGDIYLDGEKIIVSDPLVAQKHGIATIHQELTLIHTLDVAGNIFLNQEPKRGPFINHKEMYQRSREILKTFGSDIDPRGSIMDLSVAEKYIVQIARAMVHNVKYLILDESTAALPVKEVERLFEIVKNLRDQGVGVVYISHRLEELDILADRITVIRDGLGVGTLTEEDHLGDKYQIVRMMVGHEVETVFVDESKINVSENEAIRVDNITYGKSVSGVSMAINRGDIVGIAGLVGSGRSEVTQILGGALTPDKGELFVYGQSISKSRWNPHLGMKMGVAFVPSERRTQGLALILNVAENLSMASLRRYAAGGIFITKKIIRNLVDKFVKRLGIKIGSPRQKVSTLSGGNQQKVVLGKVLACECDILVVDEPTRGIDVGARREIYTIMEDLVAQGHTVIISSSDLEELRCLCNTIYVMNDGKVTAQFGPNPDKGELLKKVLGSEAAQESEGGTKKEKGKQAFKAKFNKVFARYGQTWGIILAIIVLSVIFQSMNPAFLGPRNLAGLAKQLSILVIVAAAESMVLTTRGIDASIGSTMAAAGFAAAFVADMTGSLTATIAAGILMGALIGIINGSICSNLPVETLIVTYGMMYAWRGAVLMFNGGNPMSVDKSLGIGVIDAGSTGPIPNVAILVAIVCVLLYLLFSKSVFGQHLASVGGNDEWAQVSGIKTWIVKWIAFAIGGALSGLAGILMVSRSLSAQPNVGTNIHMDALAIVIIGGMGLGGSRAHILKLILGAIIIGILYNGLNIIHVSSSPQKIVMGLLLIGVVIFDRIRNIRMLEAAK